MIDNPILKRREDENLKQYLIRICSNKDKYDISWEDVKTLMNTETGDNWGESKYRKHWYSFAQGMEYAKQQNIQSDSVLNELDLKKIELLEERKKLQTVRTEYNKIAREKSRRDLLFEYVKDGFQKLDTIEPVVDLSAYQNVQKANVLSFGDIHFGKEFQSLTNTYNEEIAMNRMNEILADTVRFLDKNDIVDLDVINLADDVEGMTLRVSQMQSLQSGFVDQVIKFSKFYAKWIRELSKYVRVNLHQITSSNHSELRMFSSKRGEYPAEDMERIIGMYIQDVLEEHDNIKINTYDNGIADFKVLDFNIVALHGHQIKNKRNVIKDLSMQRKKFYDFAFLGHLHNAETLTVGENGGNNVQIIQVPSVMGTDTYAESLFTGSRPGATIATFTQGKGLTDLHNIVL